MYHKILIILAVLLVPTPFIALLANAEDVEKLDLRNAIEQALGNNLNLQLRREDVTSSEGANLSAEGKFDVLFEGKANTQTEEKTPISIFGEPTKQDTTVWNATASKLFTTGTSVGLGWNNNSYNSDSIGLLIDPSYNTGLMLNLQQPLLRGFGQDIQTSTIKSTQKQLEAAIFQVDSEAANLAARVKNAYWSLVFAWQDIEVQKLSLKLARKAAAGNRGKDQCRKVGRSRDIPAAIGSSQTGRAAYFRRKVHRYCRR